MRPRRESTPAGAEWGARSFANRFPLAPLHEVVVPSPAHLTRWRELTLPQLQDALSLILERRRALACPGGYVHAFVNDGLEAGASISHVHAQLVGLERGDSTDRLVAGTRRADGGCALCELVSARPALHVERGLHHLLFAHPVPRLAGALLIAPLEHRVEPDESHLAELAELLRRAWAALDPKDAVNAWLVVDEEHEAHWYLELQPRSANLGGVELATGLAISAADPLDIAESARERLAMHS